MKYTLQDNPELYEISLDGWNAGFRYIHYQKIIKNLYDKDSIEYDAWKDGYDSYLRYFHNED